VETAAKETKLLTAKESAEKAGISPQVLRKILRKEFDRAGKTLVAGTRAEYRSDPDDSVTEHITARVEQLGEKPEEDSQFKKVITNLTASPIIC